MSNKMDLNNAPQEGMRMREKVAIGTGMIAMGVGIEYLAQNILYAAGNQPTITAKLVASSVAAVAGGVGIAGGIALPFMSERDKGYEEKTEAEPGVLAYGILGGGLAMFGLHLLNQVPEAMAKGDVIPAQMAYISAGVFNMGALGGIGFAVKQWIVRRKERASLK